MALPQSESARSTARPGTARAADLFKEEAEAAVLGMKTPQQAMDDLVKRVQPLLG